MGEAAVPKIVCRSRGEPFVFATNHYISSELLTADRRQPKAKDVSVYRYGYLAWRRAVSPPTDQRQIRDILRSHEPWAPCRHGGAHIDYTLWSMIALPSQGILRVSHGAPCGAEYVEYHPTGEGPVR